MRKRHARCLTLEPSQKPKLAKKVSTAVREADEVQQPDVANLSADNQPKTVDSTNTEPLTHDSQGNLSIADAPVPVADPILDRVEYPVEVGEQVQAKTATTSEEKLIGTEQKPEAAPVLDTHIVPQPKTDTY